MTLMLALERTMHPSERKFMDEEVFKFNNNKMVSGIDWDAEVIDGEEYELEVENFTNNTILIVGLIWDGRRLHITYNQETQTIRRVAHFNEDITEYWFDDL